MQVRDDAGELYFVRGPGMRHERPLVDEFGLPLLRSHVRKDPPALPYETVEELNALSDGKLKHGLVGSPSGTDLRRETERVLAFEAHRSVCEITRKFSSEQFRAVKSARNFRASNFEQ